MLKINLLEKYQKRENKKVKPKMTILLCLGIGLVGAIGLIAQTLSLEPYIAPTLLYPDRNAQTSHPRPLIKGLAKNDSLIKIFINGQLNGTFLVTNHPSGVASFAYRPFVDLKFGYHSVYAIAYDQGGKASFASNTLFFRRQLPFPAPTMFQPVINKRTTFEKPFIVGLAKNDSLIKIFINGQLNGTFLVTNHPSGVASFAYRPFVDLKPGVHLVYTTATNKNSKESIWSNLIYFQVKERLPRISAISEKDMRLSRAAPPSTVQKPISEEKAKVVAKKTPLQALSQKKVVDEKKAKIPEKKITALDKTKTEAPELKVPSEQERVGLPIEEKTLRERIKLPFDIQEKRALIIVGLIIILGFLGWWSLATKKPPSV